MTNIRKLAGGVFLIITLAIMYGPSLATHVRSSAICLNDDVFQQVTPFLRPLDQGPRDYTERYWLACLPIGYKALYH
ncbi:MAG: hypothetical protein V2A34_05625, partial [Lentisphaerota bacterium]